MWAEPIQACLWLVGGHLCLWLFTLSSLSACLCPNFLFYKDTSHTGLGPTLVTSFNLITSVKTSSPNKVTF